MRRWFWLCLLLWACGNAPVDPLAPDREDRAVQARLQDTGLLLYPASDQIVYWLLYEDGRYQFRWTLPGDRWLRWETGQWWIASGVFWVERQEGEAFDLRSRTESALGPIRTTIRLTLSGRHLRDPDLQIVLGQYVYQVVPLSAARDSLRAFEERDGPGEH